MSINLEFFRFPLDDPNWKNKAVIGALLGVFAIIIWPLYLPLFGYGVRVMRQTMKGDLPELPEWDEWGELFKDGLRYYGVQLMYGFPALAIMIAAYFLIFAGIALPALIAEQSAGLAAGGAVGAFLMGSVLFGLAMLFTFPLSFLALVAQTRVVANDSFSSAFQFSEVWSLMRAGFNNFLLAYIIFIGVAFFASFAASMLIYTIVLICLYPFVLGVATTYAYVILGAVYGRAYHATQSDVGTSELKGQPA